MVTDLIIIDEIKKTRAVIYQFILMFIVWGIILILLIKQVGG